MLILTLIPAAALTCAVAAAIIRTKDTPRKPCVICAKRSANHPAGPLLRYTRRRDLAGQPHCHRH